MQPPLAAEAIRAMMAMQGADATSEWLQCQIEDVAYMVCCVAYNTYRPPLATLLYLCPQAPVFRKLWLQLGLCQSFCRGSWEAKYLLSSCCTFLWGKMALDFRLRYSLVRAEIRLAWSVERTAHCCSLSGRFGHGSNSILESALQTSI